MAYYDSYYGGDDYGGTTNGGDGADDGDYIDSYYDDATTVGDSTISATSSSTTTASTTLTTPYTEKIPSATPETSYPEGAGHPFAGPEGEPASHPETAPEASATPETSYPEGAAHPFARPEGEPASHPETAPEGFRVIGEPEGGPERFPILGRPEGEPEGEPEFQLIPRNNGTCIWERNPWETIPEPEGEVYPEPAPPLLQYSNVRERGTYSTLAAVVATLIIFLNIAVLITLSKKPKQRKTLSYLIGLISVFDMIGGFQFLWFSSFDVNLMFTHNNMWIIIMCGIWMLTMAPQLAGMLHFGLHLLNELHVGVNNAKISAGRIVFVILTVFALPIGLFIPPLAGWNCIGCADPEGAEYSCAKYCSLAIFPFTKVYVLLMVVLLFTAMALVISTYVTIYWTICQKRCERRLSPKSGKADVIRVTTLLLFVYVLFTLPVSIVMIFDYVTVHCNIHVINAFHATMFVSFLSNLANPIIVFSTLPSMRNALRKSGHEKNVKRISNSSTDDNGIGGMNEAYSTDEKPPLDDNGAAVEEDLSATKV